MIHNFWKWYDTIQEPWRMFFMLFLISPLLLLFTPIGVNSSHQLKHPSYILYVCAYLVVLIVTRQLK